MSTTPTDLILLIVEYTKPKIEITIDKIIKLNDKYYEFAVYYSISINGVDGIGGFNDGTAELLGSKYFNRHKHLSIQDTIRYYVIKKGMPIYSKYTNESINRNITKFKTDRVEFSNKIDWEKIE